MEHIDAKNPNHILVGLGGTGGKVLKAFRKRIFTEFPEDAERNKLSIGYVYVDSTREMMVKGDPTFRVMGKDASFTESEFVDIKSVDLDRILDRVSSYPGLAHVVKNGESMRRTLGEVGKAAGQKRRAGRILFAANCHKYLSALKSQYDLVKSKTNEDKVTIHIFTGLAGGTGSGSVVDAIVQTLKMKELRYNAQVLVYAMVPELSIPTGCQAGRYHQNGYAALSELSALNAGAWSPCDVMTGDEHVDLKLSGNKLFSLMLYSNVNENGMVVDSFTELPQMLADIVYHRLFMQEKTGVTDNFLRAYSLENINDFCIEYSSKSKGFDKVPVRTKAICTFGFKRIIYPEERIIQHVTYSVGKRILWQMQYNNFKEDFGYVQEAQHKDYKQLYMDESHLREWKLDDSHLLLNEKISESDKKFEKIDDFWDETSKFYTFEEAKKNDDNPFNYIKSFCEETYKHKFRLKVGVEEYYRDKSDEKLLKEQVFHIVDHIERSLYSSWYEGKLSLYDLARICEQILIYLKNRKEKLDEEIVSTDEAISKYNQEATDNAYEGMHLGLIAKAAGKQKSIFADHQDIMKDLYIEKTRRAAQNFQGKMLAKLRVAFEEFAGQVDSFIAVLLVAMEMAENKIADRTRNKSEDLSNISQRVVVEVSEDAKMEKFEQTIVLDQETQETFAGNIRRAIVGNQEYAHFGDLAKTISADSIFDIFDQNLSISIQTLHDQNYANDRILGINVLQQLQKILVNDTDLANFAENIIKRSGVFLKFDDDALGEFIPNNPDPKSQPESQDRKSILVTLPSYEGDESLKVFAEKLEQKLRLQFGNNQANQSLIVNTSEDRKNEITIATLRYCFPMRCLQWIRQYEEDYLNMLNNKNETEAREARILLHSEGDGSNLPNLMGEPKVDLKDFTPYLFIAVATDLIVYGTDRREELGWCRVEEDEFGSKIMKLLSPKFVDVLYSESLTEDVRDQISDKITRILSNSELRVSEREALVDKVKAVMRDYVSKETTSPESPMYQEYAKHARKAMEIINKR